MSRIKGKNTKPELLVRKFLFANGFRGLTERVTTLLQESTVQNPRIIELEQSPAQ